MAVAARENDAAHRMTMQRGCQLGGGLQLNVKFLDDIYLQFLLGRESASQLRGVVARSRQNHRFTIRAAVSTFSKTEDGDLLPHEERD